MKKLFVAACIIDLAAVLVLAVYFITIESPVTDARGLLILTPPLFGVPALILTVCGMMWGKRSKLGVALLIVNTIFIFWWWIIHFGGVLLFGP